MMFESFGFKHAPPKQESSRETSERSSQRAAIEGLAIPAENLIRKLKKDIESGNIGAIIGIDGSGRIPALILSNVIANRYLKHGFPPAKTRFLRGQTADIESGDRTRKRGQEVLDAIDAMELDIERKVLVVEDTMLFGDSALPIVRELTRRGFDVEVCVFSAGPAQRYGALKEIEKKMSPAHMQYGEKKSGGESSISDHPELSGTTARDGLEKQAHAIPYKESEFAAIHAPSPASEIQESINFSRVVVDEVSERILKKL